MTGFVLDAGAFIQLERRDRQMASHARLLLARRVPLVTSAAVVAQVWRGGERTQVPIAALLRKTEVIDLTDRIARMIGRMLAASATSDPIGAHVVLLARERDWPVLTADPEELLAIDPDLPIEAI